MSVDINKTFNFNKGHRRAVFILSVIVISLIMYLYHIKTTPETIIDNEEAIEKVNSFIAAQDSIDNTRENPYKSKYKKSKPKVKLRPFNPNFMSIEELLSLGLSNRQAHTIQNYLEAGGVFKYKKDLKKIYCISDNDFLRLEPFILLEEGSSNKNKVYSSQNEIIIPIELNTAEVEDLLSIKGIGPYIAKNIIKYRTRLGGFYSIEQLKEVYGIDSSKYALIHTHFTIDTDSIAKLDLNKTSYFNLSRHPYLNKKIAFEISNHAKYEMPFRRIEELKFLDAINDSIYQKIYHYFVVY